MSRLYAVLAAILLAAVVTVVVMLLSSPEQQETGPNANPERDTAEAKGTQESPDSGMAKPLDPAGPQPATRSVDEVNEVARVCLKRRLTRDRIVALVGSPSDAMQAKGGKSIISYDYSPGQSMAFYFDATGKIEKVFNSASGWVDVRSGARAQ